MKLKTNCYRMQDDKGGYFLKVYDRASILKKVKTIHETLYATQFPYIQPANISIEKGYFKQRWVNGTTANYQYPEHRKQVYEMLKALHATNQEVNWQEKGFNQLNLKRKWQVRLAKFVENEPMIRPFLQQDYDLIYYWAEEALDDMEEINLFDEPTLLHGDVVHHNFFVGENPLIIDFDLAIIGPAIYEELMFVQRVLPMMHYNWQQLLRELPNLKMLENYSAYLRFPNELLREWCYFAMSGETEHSRLYFYVKKLTLEAKSYRHSLLHQLQQVHDKQ